MLPLSISDSSLSFALVFLHPPRCPSLSPPPPPPPPLSGDSSHPARHSHPNQRPLWSRSEHKSRGIRSSPQTAMPSSTTKGSRSPLPLPRSPPSSPLSSSLLRGPVPLVRNREQQRSARAADIGEEEESERAFVFLARHGLLPPFSQPFLSPTISLSNLSPAPNFLPPIHPHPSSLSLFLSLSLSLVSSRPGPRVHLDPGPRQSRRLDVCRGLVLLLCSPVPPGRKTRGRGRRLRVLGAPAHAQGAHRRQLRGQQKGHHRQVLPEAVRARGRGLRGPEAHPRGDQVGQAEDAQAARQADRQGGGDRGLQQQRVQRGCHRRGREDEEERGAMTTFSFLSFFRVFSGPRGFFFFFMHGFSYFPTGLKKKKKKKKRHFVLFREQLPLSFFFLSLR